ncbi:MAG: DUF4375 domain-containing protein [Xanthomonadales bacterium]|nr:DUF4375 domain-containing protein [Xanthomonadales bacterium]
MSTRENEELVARVYTRALKARSSGRELDAADLMVYHIETLSQEVNSGASFDQYFRWTSVEEISEAAGRLESLALPEVATIVRRAIDVAFPQGLPATDEEMDALDEWTEEQGELLSALAGEFEEFNGRIINVLGAFYRKSQGV